LVEAMSAGDAPKMKFCEFSIKVRIATRL